MSAEIVVFCNHLPPRLEHVELNPFKSDLIRETKENKYAVLVLIEKKWMQQLNENTDQLVYKKIKLQSKELMNYYTNTGDKLPFVDGRNYSKYKSLKISINKVLINIEQEKRFSLHFLVVSEELFNEAKSDVSKASFQREGKQGEYFIPILNLLEPIDPVKSSKIRYFGNSESCMLVRQGIATASDYDFSVLILGETGTGKEVVARNIHECSNRSSKPFISINCSAISSELFESEIFGHVKGAFTGAISDKDGLWKLANEGTLFLDEIGDLSLDHQVKILRALQEKKIRPVGATDDIDVDARIIAATNKNIEASATNSKYEFREDLYYRISTFVIYTPPLRNHPEDIPLLAENFWNKKYKKKIPQEVLNQLKSIEWKGNVRMLEHFLERLHAFFGKGDITGEKVQVLQKHEKETFKNSHDSQKPFDEKDFEKSISKIESLLKISLYCHDEISRKKILEEAKESLENIF